MLQRRPSYVSGRCKPNASSFARWAMTALDAVIDQELHEFALDLPPDGKLSGTDRTRLRETVAGWTSALHAALLVFGDSYPAAVSTIELPKLTGKG